MVSATVGQVPGKGEPPPFVARRLEYVYENLTPLHRGGARIVPGTDADLLAVAGNPLDDIRTVHDVVAVFRAGRRVR